MRQLTLALAVCLTATGAAAQNKATSAAKDAVDPKCTVEKAGKGAAMKATVGVGNRCGAAETARDVTGVDGKGKDVKKKVSN
jgi:hypothetical protein